MMRASITEEWLAGAPRTNDDEIIREGAVRWLLWLRAGEAAEREFSACERWCAQSAAHASAMHEALWLWAALRAIDGPDLQ